MKTPIEVDNIVTLSFIVLSVGVLVDNFPYDNIWTVFTGILLWLLAVANAKIAELTHKED